MKTISTIIKYGFGVGILILMSTFLFIEKDAKPLQNQKKDGLSKKIAGRYQQEFEMTKDPRTNTVPKERLMEAYAIAEQKRALKSADAFPVYWEERGPNNVGGRTRAILIDANDPAQKTVWAGSVSGGLWKTNNIDASPPGWIRINDLFENLAITTIAQDPTDADIIYFGTGEGYGNFDAVRGLGIWKSEDGGITWNVLPFTIGNGNFTLVTKVLVDSQGWVYASTATGGVQLSTNNGVSFSPVLDSSNGANTNRADDIEIASNGDIYAAMRSDGIYKLPNTSSTWSLLSTGLPSSNFGRIELTSAPGTPLTVYAAFADTTPANSGGCLGVYQSTNGGSTWNSKTVPAGIGTQCWYDFIMAVDPNDDSRVWLGTVRLFYSDNDGDSWQQANADHPDHHAIVYRPGSSDEIVFGNDGGVERTLNGSALIPAFAPKNDGYNVTQFFAVSLNPDSGSDEMIGGTQDNATPVFSSSGIGSTNCVLCCCDGGYAHIDQDDPMIQIASTQNGSFSLSTTGSGGAFNNILPGSNSRRFITPSDYDSNNNVFYFSDGTDTLGRIIDIGGANTVSLENIPLFGGSKISSFAVSPNTPNRLFVGLGNGRLIQVDNADVSGGVTATNLNTPASGFLSSVAVENGDDQHILISYSNYGVVSIWETTDGGGFWKNVEGNFPDIPVRWVMFHPFDPEQALIATDLGVWTSADLTEMNPDWQPTNGFGLANVRVDMLVYRSSDHTIAAATHGRGIYTTTYFGMLADCQPNLNLAGIIAPGIYTASEVITTDGTVQGATAVILQAGEMVTLEADFTAERGSDFWALILPCDASGSFTDNQDEQYYLIKPDNTEIVETQEENIKKATEKLICYPNPTQSIATIEYKLSEDKNLRIVVMNARGQLVDVLADGYYNAGIQKFQWNTDKLESGLYFIQAQMRKEVSTEKVFVVK